MTKTKFFTVLFLIITSFVFSQTIRKFRGTYHKKEIELLVHSEKGEEKMQTAEMKFIENGVVYKVFFTQVTATQISIDVFDKELEFCNGDLFSNGGKTFKGTLSSVLDEKRKLSLTEIPN